MPEPDPENTFVPWKGNLLDLIRHRPAMYIGDKSLTGLWYLLNGYDLARQFASPEPEESSLPRDFADWVAYRLQETSNWGGFWNKVILSRVRDESLALDRFYELRDEYLQRQPNIVATIRKDRLEYQIHELIGKTLESVEVTRLLSSSLRIVTYTDDPGFFLVADENPPYPYSGWFCLTLSDCGFPIKDRFEVHDEATWSRLVEHDRKYRRNFKRRVARRGVRTRQNALLDADPTKPSNKT